MKDISYYAGREQTFVKHFFLDRYLERLAFNIFSFRDEFVYVDGFSGPWRSADEDLADTSFFIAREKLTAIAASLSETKRRTLTSRFLFIERERDAFEELRRFCAGLEANLPTTLHSAFEDAVSEVCQFVGRDFSFTFIDPTGWTGFEMTKISPVLQLRGEVLINFMFNDVNRFLEDPRREISSTLDGLFGDAFWYDEFVRELERLGNREEAVISVYLERLRRASTRNGQVPFVTSVRVKNPTADRTYFHLCYMTRSWKGIYEFRNVEKETLEIESAVRLQAKLRKKEALSGQPDLLFGVESADDLVPLRFERTARLVELKEKIDRVLSKNDQISMKELIGHALEIPLILEMDLKAALVERANDGEIEFRVGDAESSIPTRQSMIIVKSH